MSFVIPKPVLFVDLTDDDPESQGIVVSGSLSNAGVIDLSMDDDEPGPTITSNFITNPMPGTSSGGFTWPKPLNDNLEWETPEYYELLKKMEFEFNQEPLPTEFIPPVNDIVSPVPAPAISPQYVTPVQPLVQSPQITEIPSETFPKLEMIENAPVTHKYKSIPFHSTNKDFLSSLNKDRAMMQKDLPPGIYVKMYENRLDLLTAMIEGPSETPYEGCLFLFDIQLNNDHPNKPPKVYYTPFCVTKLNPNLYSSGYVCLSLLGTWKGSAGETWTPKSTIYQLLISIQGLILVPEPFYNEPCYHSAKGTGRFTNESKKYNANTLSLVLQSMIAQIQNPPPGPFKAQIIAFYKATGLQTLNRMEGYVTAKVTPKFPVDSNHVKILPFRTFSTELSKILNT